MSLARWLSEASSSSGVIPNELSVSQNPHCNPPANPHAFIDVSYSMEQSALVNVLL